MLANDSQYWVGSGHRKWTHGQLWSKLHCRDADRVHKGPIVCTSNAKYTQETEHTDVCVHRVLDGHLLCRRHFVLRQLTPYLPIHVRTAG